MRRLICAAAAVCAVSAAACGKKGPPLAPLVPIPSAVETIAAERVGNDVFVSFTLPIDNIDDHAPANLARVEVYGYTGRVAPPRGRVVEFGALVASVPVAPPPPEPGEEPDPKAPAVDPAWPKQGSSVTVRDLLTADELVQGREPAPEKGRVGVGRASVPTPTGVGSGTDPDPTGIRPGSDPAPTGVRPGSDPAPTGVRPGADPVATPRREPAAPLKRFYATITYNDRGQPGPPGTMTEMILCDVPPAPPAVEAGYDETGILVSWEPAGGIIGFLLQNGVPDDVPWFVEDADLPPDRPSGPLQYNVYREIGPDPIAPPPPAAAAAAWNARPPAPVNALPLPAQSFTDTIEFGRRRCYTVRAVRGAGPAALVGAVSPPACVTPIDVFGPSAPQSLAAVATEGGISLIWEPVGDLDLAGYVVLRGGAGDDTLQPLGRTAASDASYRDTAVSSGQRYVYAVVAVDNRFPLPNMSGESNRVEETAR